MPVQVVEVKDQMTLKDDVKRNPATTTFPNPHAKGYNPRATSLKDKCRVRHRSDLAARPSRADRCHRRRG